MKNALITGTSSGIGLATSLELAMNGYRVFAGMRNLAKAQELRSKAEHAQLPIQVIEMDVLSQASVDAALSTVRQSGPVDVLVNNAGIGAACPLELTSEADHKAIFETNYFGAIRCIQAVLPEMRERRGGTIVNVTSMEGVMAFPNQIPYSASKWALECAGEALAHEMAQFNVRVVNIEPGVIMTKIFENAKPMNYFDKTSPYVQTMRRNGKMFAAAFRNPTEPVAVAQCIREAIESDLYRLRWLVGNDAKTMAAGRRAMSDEEWIAMGKEMSDEEYNRLFAAHFAIEL